MLMACSDSHMPRSSKENKEDAVLKALANCQHLTLNNKKLTDINKIHLCPNIRIIHAFDNKLTDLSPLVHARYIAAAYLHNNIISSIPVDLGVHMKHLTRLYLNRNHITLFRGWAGVQGAVLEELHIAGQSGDTLQFEEASMKALSQCLKVLDVSFNNFTDLRPLQNLRSLRSFFADNNKIENIRDFTIFSDRNPSLIVCSALNNPCTTGVAKLREFRDAIVLSCTAIEFINGKSVNAAERSFLREKAKRLPQGN